MKFSELFTKTRKEAPKDEVSRNAQLLIRAGFIHKEMAGVYDMLPLGLRVLRKIEQIIREEMNAVGASEIKMSALQSKELWEKSERWSDDVVDNWFKTNLKGGGKLGLGFTHEEPLANALKDHINSYQDLPKYTYQIQTKFRNEERAKAGLMRGREFSMKDLYSFSKDEEEHNKFYDSMKDVYMKVFERLGIKDDTFLTASNGAPFSKYSYEFQTISDAGEDTIIIDENKKVAINKADFNDEIVKDLGLDGFEVTKEAKSIEVGDIYSLGTKYAEAVGLKYKDEGGKENFVYMGSYGMSPTRLMGTIVEVSSDDKGIVWPLSVAPFRVHLIALQDDEDVMEEANKIYESLISNGIEVLLDDRKASAGEKFNDADLIGVPVQIIVSKRSVDDGNHEVKNRKTGEVTHKTFSDIVEGDFDK
jgi:prolyl-tRNA synthetase